MRWRIRCEIRVGAQHAKCFICSKKHSVSVTVSIRYNEHIYCDKLLIMTVRVLGLLSVSDIMNTYIATNCLSWLYYWVILGPKWQFCIVQSSVILELLPGTNSVLITDSPCITKPKSHFPTYSCVCLAGCQRWRRRPRHTGYPRKALLIHAVCFIRDNVKGGLEVSLNFFRKSPRSVP